MKGEIVLFLAFSLIVYGFNSKLFHLSSSKTSVGSAFFPFDEIDSDVSSGIPTGVAIGVGSIALPAVAHAQWLNLGAAPALAQGTSSVALNAQSLKDIYDPTLFQPVCPASDGVYQGLKVISNSVVGQDNVVEYGPLIASVLLRIRLELCVLESFLYEAVIPFVQKKGVSWILPLHETLETLVAGTIFAVASNFILLGSTKIVSVLVIYIDALTALPLRLLGGTLRDKLPAKSAGHSIGSALKAYGDVIGGLRTFLEAADTFVGRYLVIATTIYIGFKFAHYRFFNY